MPTDNLYKQGLNLSRNYDNRDIEATKILYVLLQEASLKAQIPLRLLLIRTAHEIALLLLSKPPEYGRA